MIFTDTVFQAVEARRMKRFNISGLKTQLIQSMVRQYSEHITLQRKDILRAIDGEQREGVELSYAVMMLQRDEYRQILGLLLELAGGDKENATYKQVRAIMEKRAG